MRQFFFHFCFFVHDGFNLSVPCYVIWFVEVNFCSPMSSHSPNCESGNTLWSLISDPIPPRLDYLAATGASDVPYSWASRKGRFAKQPHPYDSAFLRHVLQGCRFVLYKSNSTNDYRRCPPEWLASVCKALPFTSWSIPEGNLCCCDPVFIGCRSVSPPFPANFPKLR